MDRGNIIKGDIARSVEYIVGITVFKQYFTFARGNVDILWVNRQKNIVL